MTGTIVTALAGIFSCAYSFRLWIAAISGQGLKQRNGKLRRGSGTPWGITRNWTNGVGYAQENIVGNGMVVEQQPRLVRVDGTKTLAVITNGHTAHYFDLIDGVYQARGYLLSTLEYNGTTDLFTLTTASGEQYRFFGYADESPTRPRGQIESFQDAADHSTTFTYSGGRLVQVFRSVTIRGVTVDESFVYAYVSGGVNAGLLRTVTLRRRENFGTWFSIRSVEYDYYEDEEAHGNARDLKTATIKDAAGSEIGTTYYRYYTAADIENDEQGYVHGLKYVFEARSFGRLAAAVADPFTATDEEAAPYADNYFEYDEQQRAVKEIAAGAGYSVRGGLGEFTYTYDTSENDPGYNAWAVKTTETLPDGNTKIVFTNFMGQVMLSVVRDGATEQAWETYYRYDEAGRLVLNAGALAVTGYNEAYADLLHEVDGNLEFLSDDDGLIAVRTYYTETTATSTAAGAAAGYLQQAAVRQGELGGDVPQLAKTYIARAAGGGTIYLAATSSVYANTDGTGELTTSYAYTFFAGKLQVKSKAVTGPAGETTTQVHDAFGRVTWQRDAAGILSFVAYGQATGAVRKRIVDVDTTLTGDFTDKPAGWTTPEGAGLHLVTKYEVDSQGRATKVTDANGNVTYTVYHDAAHEVRAV